ncbi:rod shape-determining protein MreC [bacterium]|nr:rod shape-determining protein MreC [bacterium]
MRNKIWLGVLMVTIIFLLNLFQKDVKGVFYSFSAPFQRILFSASVNISNFVKSIGQAQMERIENERLRKKIKELMAENIKLKKVEEENERLRRTLKIKPRSDFNFFLSRIISKDAISSDSILIKGGAEDGIKVGMPVVTPEMVLVGRVEETLDRFSRVQLIFSKGFSFDVEILKEGNQTPIYGLIRGKGGFKIFLDNVSLKAKIEEEDVLTTAALGGIFPQGLLVGEVKKVSKSNVQPFQVAEVSPFLDINDLRELFIITKW